jgi:hypothetical protein
MFRLVRPVDRHTDVLGLVGGQFGQLDTEFVQVQASQSALNTALGRSRGLCSAVISQPVDQKRPVDPLETHPVIRAVGLVEAAAGLCLTSFFVVGVLIVGVCCDLLLNVGHQHPWVALNPVWPWAIGWIVLSALGARSLGFIGRSIEIGHQRRLLRLPVFIASRRLNTPAPLRPVVALWWTLLAFGSLVTAHYLAAYLRVIADRPHDTVYRVGVPAVILFAAAVGSNTSLLVATAAASGNEALVRAVYRVRLPIDIGLTYLLFATPLPRLFGV